MFAHILPYFVYFPPLLDLFTIFSLFTLFGAYLPLIALIWPHEQYSPKIDILLLKQYRCAK